ncbi:unnamed protein product [Ectocarpus sp. 12 AP-2014]
MFTGSVTSTTTPLGRESEVRSGRGCSDGVGLVLAHHINPDVRRFRSLYPSHTKIQLLPPNRVLAPKRNLAAKSFAGSARQTLYDE